MSSYLNGHQKRPGSIPGALCGRWRGVVCLLFPLFPSAPLSLISQYAGGTSLIVNSDDAILAVFDTYSRFEAASGAKLKLEWTSEKIKVLIVYVGPSDLEEADWRPQITAVENVLASRRQRALSFRGRALVIGSLALTRIWYVGSFVHMRTLCGSMLSQRS